MARGLYSIITLCTSLVAKSAIAVAWKRLVFSILYRIDGGNPGLGTIFDSRSTLHSFTPSPTFPHSRMLPSEFLLSSLFLLGSVFPSVHSAFTYKFGVPGSCDDLEISWTGPFVLCSQNNLKLTYQNRWPGPLRAYFSSSARFRPMLPPRISLKSSCFPRRSLEHQGLSRSPIQQ